MIQQTLFGETDTGRPLASRMRPRDPGGICGPEASSGRRARCCASSSSGDQCASMIFWGPPGVGKTTLARIIANSTQAEFHRLQRRDQRHQERSRTVMQTAEAEPPLRRKDHPLRGRDPPLQQSAAGRVSALCGKGKHHPHRRHHGKPFVRDQLARCCPGARCLCCSASVGRGAIRTCCAGRWQTRAASAGRTGRAGERACWS